jgi:hypothetical protein
MKKYVWLLAFLVTQAQATGVIAQGYMGKVVISLTNAACHLPHTAMAYAYYPDGKAEIGCWAADESRVFVLLPRGDLRSFPLSFFDTGRLK